MCACLRGSVHAASPLAAKCTEPVEAAAASVLAVIWNGDGPVSHLTVLLMDHGEKHPQTLLAFHRAPSFLAENN